jgi:hypothetical protein
MPPFGPQPTTAGNTAAEHAPAVPAGTYFAGMTFAIELGDELGMLPFARRAALVRQVVGAGGRVTPVVDAETTAVLSRRHTAREFDGSLALQHAVRSGVPIVAAKGFLRACEAAGVCADVAAFVVKVPSESRELRGIVSDVRSAAATAVGHRERARYSASVPRRVIREVAERALRRDTSEAGVAKLEAQAKEVRWYESYDERASAAARAATTSDEEEREAMAPWYPVDVSVDGSSAGYEVLRSHGLTASSGLELHGVTGVAVVKPYRVMVSMGWNPLTLTRRAAFFAGSEAAEACYEAEFLRAVGRPGGLATAAEGSTFAAEVYGSLAAQRVARTRFDPSAASSTSKVPEAVTAVVQRWFAEAWGQLQRTTSAASATDAASALGRISLLDVYRAEAVLLELAEVLATRLEHATAAPASVSASPPGYVERIASLSAQYYKLIPAANGATAEQTTLGSAEQLAEAEDTLRILRAVLSVGESAGGNVFQMAPSQQYRSLGCELEEVKASANERLNDLVAAAAAATAPGGPRLRRVFAVRREDEHRAYSGARVGNSQLLVHGTHAGSVAAIVSQGLRVPKAARLRRDRGMLGRGIYFGSEMATALKYAGWARSPGESSARAYVLVAEVALGRTYETERNVFGLERPPPGYDSVHGVRSADGSTDFTEDEFVVYDATAQRLRYVLEYEREADATAAVLAAPPAPPPASAAPPSAVGNQALVAPATELGAVAVKAVQAGLQSQGGEEPVPLRSTRVKAAVIDLIAEVTLFQEYENTSGTSVEAKYVFPLQRGAAVCGFEAFINAKRVVGVVKEKEEARREYRKAVEAGHGAYLMDESEETPEVFTVSVGNLPPWTRVVVKIVYVIELKVDAAKGAIELVVPSSVHPYVRDVELKTQTQRTTGTVASRSAATDVEIEVGLDMPFDIVAVECSHAAERKRTACRATLRAREVDLTQGDFVVLTRLAVMHTPRIWVEEHPRLGTRAAMITFFPEVDESLGRGSGATKAVVPARELVVLLDGSGSMGHGSAAEDAKVAALLTIDTLPAAWRLNVCVFGSGQVYCFPRSVVASAGAKAAAKAFVQSMYGAIYGGTNCVEALRQLAVLSGGCRRGVAAKSASGLPMLVEAQAAAAAGRQVEVLLLSDGLLEQEAAVHQVLREAPGLRLFTAAVGTGAAVACLVGAARQGRGQAVTLSSGSKSRWAESVGKQLERAGRAALTEVAVEWSTEANARVRDGVRRQVRQSPASVASVFHGESSVVYGVARGVQTRQCELVARHTGAGVSRDQYGDWPEQRFLVTVHGLSFRSGAVIHRLAAKARIRDWVEGSLLEAPTAGRGAAGRGAVGGAQRSGEGGDEEGDHRARVRVRAGDTVHVDGGGGGAVVGGAGCAGARRGGRVHDAVGGRAGGGGDVRRDPGGVVPGGACGAVGQPGSGGGACRVIVDSSSGGGFVAMGPRGGGGSHRGHRGHGGRRWR